MHVKVRGQPVGLGSPLHHVSPGIKLRLSGLVEEPLPADQSH